MERILKNGDYVPNGAGGLVEAVQGEEVLARALFRLTARRGGLPFLPQLGSRLYTLSREKPSVRQALAEQYVAQALGEEANVGVQSVELSQQGDGGTLTVKLLWRGETLTGQVIL